MIRQTIGFRGCSIAGQLLVMRRQGAGLRSAFMFIRSSKRSPKLFRLEDPAGFSILPSDAGVPGILDIPRAPILSTQEVEPRALKPKAQA